MSAKEPAASEACPHCGARSEAVTGFCRSCGVPLGGRDHMGMRLVIATAAILLVMALAYFLLTGGKPRPAPTEPPRHSQVQRGATG